MLIHPDLLLDLSKAHQRDLIVAADQHRLLSAARRSRRSAAAGPTATPAARGRPDGTLATCGSHVVAPAR